MHTLNNQLFKIALDHGKINLFRLNKVRNLRCIIILGIVSLSFSDQSTAYSLVERNHEINNQQQCLVFVVVTFDNTIA